MGETCTQGKFSSRDIRLNVEAHDCRDAIQKAADPLIEQGYITEGYVRQINEAFDHFGPYFVLAPGMAFPHAKPSEHVLKTGLSLITLKHPVSFGHSQNDPVSIVCVIASRDSQEHLEQLKRIIGFLSDADLVDLLHRGKTDQDVREILDRINAQ